MAQEIERFLDNEQFSIFQQNNILDSHADREKQTNESFKIALKLRDLFPEEVIEINRFGGQVSATVRKEKIKEILQYLKEHEGFNHLQDLCGVDYYPEKPRFEVVYNLYSIWRRLHIRIKAKISEEESEIDSVTELWSGANWHERECFDMFGIRFLGHPDLRRILMPEDWNGHPLKKDYPLRGKELWRGFREIIDLLFHNPERQNSEEATFSKNQRDSSVHRALRNDEEVNQKDDEFARNDKGEEI